MGTSIIYVTIHMYIYTTMLYQSMIIQVFCTKADLGHFQVYSAELRLGKSARFFFYGKSFSRTFLGKTWFFT